MMTCSECGGYRDPGAKTGLCRACWTDIQAETAKRICNLRLAHPDYTQKLIALEVDRTKAQVSQVLKRAGLPTRAVRLPPAKATAS